LVFGTVSRFSSAAEIPVAPDTTPTLGVPAAPEHIAAWDIDIAPDGSGLPSGSGTPERGRVLYDQLCAACHGPEGIGASAEELAGGSGDLTGDWPDKTIGTYWPYAVTLFDFIRRSKPMATPGSLGNDEVYALTAYLLELNGIIDGSKPLDATGLSAVVMPNREGFVDCYHAPPGSKECPY
jgi:cytochrome c